MFTQYSKFLTEEQRQMVHEASMEVLENTGLLVHADCAREIFRPMAVMSMPMVS